MQRIFGPDLACYWDKSESTGMAPTATFNPQNEAERVDKPAKDTEGRAKVSHQTCPNR